MANADKEKNREIEFVVNGYSFETQEEYEKALEEKKSIERLMKKADNNTVIKAIVEILKRYPTAKQSEKLELEIRKLREQLDSGIEGTMNLNIVNAWEDISNDND